MPKIKKRKGESKDQQYVRSEMTSMKKGTLHSGSKDGPKVTNPKQAIAIGLSEARGKKVAGEPNKRAILDKQQRKKKSQRKGRS